MPWIECFKYIFNLLILGISLGLKRSGLEATIPGSTFGAGHGSCLGPQLSDMLEQEFLVAGALNLGCLDVRGSADSLKLLTTCPVTVHITFFLEDPKLLFPF